jgi:hypothetical protein
VAFSGHLQGCRHGVQDFERAKRTGRGCVVLAAGATTAPHPSNPSLATLPPKPRGLATVLRRAVQLKVYAPHSSSKI